MRGSVLFEGISQAEIGVVAARLLGGDGARLLPTGIDASIVVSAPAAASSSDR